MRALAVVIVAALTAFQIVRTAAVEDRDERPSLANSLWPSHPAVLTAQALLAIGSAAARGQPVSEATRADVRRIATRAPLSPDPFLVEGAIAETEGRGPVAERLLLAARDRDPRSRGARYLLADRFFRSGRVTRALIEMQALVSLQDGGAEHFVPALVGYARTPGAVPELKAFFRDYPRVEAAVLTALATDAANADLVLALASDARPDPDWRRPLISTLAASGQYAKAHEIWGKLAGGQGRGGLFNPAFQELPALPPFNWAYPGGSEGVAEPDGKGALEVLYYGRTNAVLASQLLLLPPATYQLAATVEDSSREEGSLRWRLRCAPDNRILLELPLRRGAVAGAFAVPNGCEAQWLELQGVAGDLPRTSELTIRGLRLARGLGQ